eukprot:TRINITY_DN22696_c0_g1_i1.p1 TRINITY_DN22696_c0_g1~~TRINITY_DN22696_c0_g1_i1.p1  ORF type:complete len:446 (+),score=117.86 TRINITY_DN22696_c0_g1_i1:641-1978(+)
MYGLLNRRTAIILIVCILVLFIVFREEEELDKTETRLQHEHHGHHPGTVHRPRPAPAAAPAVIATPDAGAPVAPPPRQKMPPIALPPQGERDALVAKLTASHGSHSRAMLALNERYRQSKGRLNLTATELVAFVRESHVPYADLLKTGLLVEDLSTGERDMNVFVPVRGRREAAEHCLMYLAHAAKAFPLLRIVVTLVEMDDVSSLADVAREFDADYLFVPTALSKLAGSGATLSKSLGYNLAFLRAREAGWALFLEVDFLVPEDFIKWLYHGYLGSRIHQIGWMLPYANGSLFRLSEAASTAIWASKTVVPVAELNHTVEAQPNPAAVLVRHDLFQDVGGFDPELFFGFTEVEDDFLFSKLSVLDHTHFADVPPIHLYHLYHPPAQHAADFAFEPLMRRLRDDFDGFSELDKRLVLSAKKDLLVIGGMASEANYVGRVRRLSER